MTRIDDSTVWYLANAAASEVTRAKNDAAMSRMADTQSRLERARDYLNQANDLIGRWLSSDGGTD